MFNPLEIDEKLKNKQIKIDHYKLKSIILSFISSHIQNGLIYDDPFLYKYAIAFFKNLHNI